MEATPPRRLLDRDSRCCGGRMADEVGEGAEDQDEERSVGDEQQEWSRHEAGIRGTEVRRGAGEGGEEGSRELEHATQVLPRSRRDDVRPRNRHRRESFPRLPTTSH